MKIKKIIASVLTVAVLICFVALIITDAKKQPVKADGFAMGSYVSVTVYEGTDSAARNAVETIKNLDSKYLSHSVGTSAVSVLNSEKTFTGDEFFTEYLKLCIGLSENCDGFTLFSSQLKSLWQVENGGCIPGDEETDSILTQINNTNLNFENGKITLSGNSLLDLGALGKGTACEQAILSLKNEGIKNALCTVGGSVGVIGSPDKGDRFTIGIRNPFGAVSDFIGTLSVTDCYISTSGDYEKYFEFDGKKYCHIFDARTGKPVQSDITSVTAVADSGTLSDYLSTAVFISGEEVGTELAEKYNAELIIIKKDKTVTVTSGLKNCFELTNSEFKWKN